MSMFTLIVEGKSFVIVTRHVVGAVQEGEQWTILLSDGSKLLTDGETVIKILAAVKESYEKEQK